MLSRTQENRACKLSTFLKIKKDTMVWLIVQVQDMPVGLQLVQGQQIMQSF